MSSTIFVRLTSIAVLFTINHLSLMTGQYAGYNFDIAPNSRLIQSLGLDIPSSVPITTTTSTTSRRLVSNYANLFEPSSAPLLLQRPRATTAPQAVTYLTVDERPRAARDRTQVFLTVSDANRRRAQPAPPPPPPPPSYTNEVSDDSLKPYSFSYEANDDESGSRSSRSEQSDGKTVTGSYSYIDADGVYRTVEYVADENGFRANVKTNEPGTSKSSTTDPANTNWQVESPPEAVLVKYLKKY